MNAASRCPSDLRLVFHDSLSDSYELSKVLLASVDFDGTLQLLTSGWERLLGYGREELEGKTLGSLMWSDRRRTAAAVAAILERLDLYPVHLRLRCRDGRGKCLKLNRLYDKRAHMMHIVAEEAADDVSSLVRGPEERRMALRPPSQAPCVR